MNAAEIRAAFDAAGTDKGHYHNYDSVYARIDRVPERVLELGVAEGASLAAWRMLWPDADIWGIDTNVSGVRIQADSRMHIVQGDAFTWSSPIDHRLMFDLIVDDANHRLTAQQFGLQLYWPQLRSGGWYVIEDIYDTGELPTFSQPGDFTQDWRGYYSWITQKP